MTGKGDFSYLKKAFNKLLLGYSWWANRVDQTGDNVFEGGFLGLDNIGVFDRRYPLPDGSKIEQSAPGSPRSNGRRSRSSPVSCPASYRSPIDSW